MTIQVTTSNGATKRLDTPLFIQTNVIKMDAPTRLSVTKDTMEVKWESENLDSYDLHWDEGSGIVSTPLYEGTKTTFKVSGLEADRIYRFKVRGKNQCGYGEFSDVALFLTGDSCPSPPPPPTVSVTGGNVVVKWEKPVAAVDELPIS